LDDCQTDPEQIRAAIGGDREALRAVWRAHRRWVAAVLLAHKPRQTDLDDLLQAVALQVCRKVHEVRDPVAFRPWLRMVAINAARADGRATGRQRRGFLRLVGRTGGPGADERLDEQTDRRREGERLIMLARTLPEGYREPLLMRCVRGMSYRAIGEAMGLPETTVETRIARGRRMLRELAAAETDPAANTGEPVPAGA
jgi:RNA polymerase sigma-70 factor (ECF subfamily)